MPLKGVKRVKKSKESLLGQFKGHERYNKALGSLEDRYKGKTPDMANTDAYLGFNTGRALKRIRKFKNIKRA
jgi:hypothetical protein